MQVHHLNNYMTPQLIKYLTFSLPFPGNVPFYLFPIRSLPSHIITVITYFKIYVNENQTFTSRVFGRLLWIKSEFWKLDDLFRFLSVNQNLGLYKMRMSFSQGDQIC